MGLGMTLGERLTSCVTRFSKDSGVDFLGGAISRSFFDLVEAWVSGGSGAKRVDSVGSCF